MGVYINMELPKWYTKMEFGYDADGNPQVIVGEDVFDAVPVPKHGRLGDLDELLDRAFGCLDEETFLAFQFLVNGSVTIIPASEEGEA